MRTIGGSRRQVLGSIVIEALVVGIVASVVGLVPRARARQPACSGSSTRSASRSRTAGSVFETAHDRRRAARRDPRHARREPPPGDPRHPRPADRRRARGRDAAGVAVRALPARSARRSCSRAPGSRRSCTASSARASTRPACSSGWASARCSSSSASRSSPRASSARSPGALGWLGDAPRRRGGALAPRQRAPEPAADRVDRGGADDRARARHARRHARRRDHVDVPRTPSTSSGADADYAITAQNNFSPIPVAAADAAADVAGRRGGRQRPHRRRAGVRRLVLRDRRRTPRRRRSSTSTGRRARTTCSPSSATTARSSTTATPRTTTSRLGSPIELTFANGDRKRSTIEGVFEPPPGGSPFGHVTISADEWDRHTENPRNLYSFVRMEGGQTDANAAALERGARGVPEREGGDAGGVHRQPDLRASARSSTSSTCCSRSPSSSACSGSSTRSC